MNDFDPTDPWGQKSPWDAAGQTQTPPTQEAPMPTPPVVASTAPNPFKIGFTLKAAAGYDAEWLTPTVYGSTAQETAERGKELLLAMKGVGLIDLTAQAADYTRGQFKGGPKAQATPPAQPSFNNGQVQFGNQAPNPPFGGGPEKPAIVPDGYTYREGTNKSGKPYKAWFPPRGSDASPIWV